MLGSGKPFFLGPLPSLRLVANELIAEDVIRLTYAPAAQVPSTTMLTLIGPDKRACVDQSDQRPARRQCGSNAAPGTLYKSYGCLIEELAGATGLEPAATPYPCAFRSVPCPAGKFQTFPIMP